jgi:hypothetical protein
MERPMSLELEAETSTFYTWEVPGKAISIRLDFGVVDQVLSEAMQGFGSVPKRGAEVGGLLLGSITEGERTIVHIRDFEAVSSEHARGPSYLLSEADEERLTAAVERWREDPPNRDVHVVGVYRSQTRDGLGLSEDDLALFEKHFPGPSQVFLLVKPFATRASAGAFFFREGGAIRGESSYLEFPFRRRDLGGGVAAPEPVEAPTAAPPAAARTEHPEPVPPRPRRLTTLSLSDDAAPSAPEPAAPAPKLKRNVWIPLSFIFMLVGVMLGFQAAISLRPAGSAAVGREPFLLSLTAEQSGNTVNLFWDRQAPVILRARSGLLTIADGSFNKSLELDPSQLQNGSVIYRYLTNRVMFRLEVFSRNRASVVETVEIHTGVGAAAPEDDSSARTK